MPEPLSRRTFATTLTGALTGALTGTLMAAKPRPAAANDRPLRMILPVGAGSGVDTIIRAAAPSLTRTLNQPVVVENLPGAGGTIGALAVVKAPADGTVVGVVSNNHVVNPLVYKKMPFDAIEDITPISVIGASPFLLVVNPQKLPVRTAPELQAALKARPGAYNYASSGNGTVLHLGGEMFAQAAGVDVRHVPYKGVGPMITDLIGGQVDFGILAVPAVQAHLKSGALRAVGVTGRTRVASMPDLPTFAEQGFPDVDIAGWFAVIGPPKLPAAEVKRLHDGFVAGFETPETRAAMDRQQNQIAPMTPEASAAFFRSEMARYAAIVRKAGISLD